MRPGMGIGQQEREDVTRKSPRKVQQKKSEMPEALFERQADDDQRVHVEANMQKRTVQEHGRHESP